MMVGPNRAMFMDEITNGLDSSTAFQIISCLQHFVHLTDATVLISLLQPPPETFDLFDDLILMAQNKIIYHGPRDRVLQFFDEHCGFKCPTRKSVADFLQEVISRKDQQQFWSHETPYYGYVSADEFHAKFVSSELGRELEEEVNENNDSFLLSGDFQSVSNWEVFKACASRELLLMKRNSFVYVFKTTQVSYCFELIVVFGVILGCVLECTRTGSQPLFLMCVRFFFIFCLNYFLIYFCSSD